MPIRPLSAALILPRCTLDLHSDISLPFQNFYGERFGEENLKMIKDSNIVERDKLEQTKAYIQITYVEPYFDAYEKLQRHTYFHKNYNISEYA
jgi:hypothetical protein